MKKPLLLSGLLAASQWVAAEQTIDDLKAQLDQQAQQIEALAAQMESYGTSGASLASKTQMGGYGELHYNQLHDQDGSGTKEQIDFHRFVLFVSHTFNERTRFVSELELEHSLSGDGKPGEVELEQAYVEYDMTPNHKFVSGLYLIPVGLLNETHEPDTFYGVERNPVEKNIIPTTWWEGGLLFKGSLGDQTGLFYDVALHSGLHIDVTDEEGSGVKHKVRDGREKVSKADAEAFAGTARIVYSGLKGFSWGLTVQYQEDVSQGYLEASDPSKSGISGQLIETHITYQVAGFGLRALYAAWSFDDEMNTIEAGAAKQEGFYVEPSYRINEKWGVFARYNEWDNTADDSVDSKYTQTDLGVNFWLHPQVVLKADLQQQNHADGLTEQDGINLGFGYSF